MALRIFHRPIKDGLSRPADEEILLAYTAPLVGDTTCTIINASNTRPPAISRRRDKSDASTILGSDDECQLWEASVADSQLSTSIHDMSRVEKPPSKKRWHHNKSWIMLSDDEAEKATDASTMPPQTVIVGKKPAVGRRRRLAWNRTKSKSTAQKTQSKTSKFLQRIVERIKKTKHPEVTKTMSDESSPLVNTSMLYSQLEDVSSKDEDDHVILYSDDAEVESSIHAHPTAEKVHYELAHSSSTASARFTIKNDQLGNHTARMSKSSRIVHEILLEYAEIEQDTSPRPDTTIADILLNNHVKAKVKPPVNEVAQYHRTYSSDISDVSSTSSYQMALEFSLDNGFGARSKYLHAMSETIVRNLERLESKEEKTTAKCLVLLMHPSHKIFEIVQVPYAVEGTTIGDFLAKLPTLATDRRLTRLHYTGLSYQGMPISAPMVPLEIILDALSNRKPLFAIPDKYPAKEIEELGNWLIETPSVAKLIQDQLDKMERSMAQPHPRSSLFADTTKNNDVSQVARRATGNPSPFLSRQLHGRNEVKNLP